MADVRDLAPAPLGAPGSHEQQARFFSSCVLFLPGLTYFGSVLAPAWSVPAQVATISAPSARFKTGAERRGFREFALVKDYPHVCFVTSPPTPRDWSMLLHPTASPPHGTPWRVTTALSNSVQPPSLPSPLRDACLAGVAGKALSHASHPPPLPPPQLLALLCLGEIGRRTDLSAHTGLEQTVTEAFQVRIPVEF
jgi:hypothetical protein